MAFSYRLRERAREDLREISDHIAEDDPRAALNLYDRFVVKFELLAAHPEIGKKRPEFGEGIRCLVVGNYLILYHLPEETVEILRVLHGARDIQAEDVDR